MKVRDVSLEGLECVELSNGTISLLVARDVGPRVLSLKTSGGPNVFAEFPPGSLNRPCHGAFEFRGGHRLWRAPEDPRLTYLPDNAPVDVQLLPDGIRLVQPVEIETGMEKQIEIRLPGDPRRVIVNHSFANRGREVLRCALWAITMFKPGGVALLPQPVLPDGQSDLLPSRAIVLWPYSDINSPHLKLGNDCILLRADLSEGRLKIGYPNMRGWSAYWWEGILFVKRAPHVHGAAYCDLGSSLECYCDSRFIELESLSPEYTIPPGGSAAHLEVWDIVAQVPWPADVMEWVRSIEEGLS